MGKMTYRAQFKMSEVLLGRKWLQTGGQVHWQATGQGISDAMGTGKKLEGQCSWQSRLAQQTFFLKCIIKLGFRLTFESWSFETSALTVIILHDWMHFYSDQFLILHHVCIDLLGLNGAVMYVLTPSHIWFRCEIFINWYFSFYFASCKQELVRIV